MKISIYLFVFCLFIIFPIFAKENNENFIKHNRELQEETERAESDVNFQFDHKKYVYIEAEVNFSKC
jgi:hypothetical protein